VGGIIYLVKTEERVEGITEGIQREKEITHFKTQIRNEVKG
jgi:hypothetical protein